MAKTISKKISVKTSSDNPLVKPPPRDKTLGIEPAIRLYNLKEGDDTAEKEEAEILVVHHSNPAFSNQNLVKRRFPYIDTHNYEKPIVVDAIRELTSGVF